MTIDGASGARPTQARTRLARRAVVQTASALFVERGYGATTMEAISEAAGVPTATVYRLFDSKPGILKAVIDVSIVGDDEDIAMADRQQVRTALGSDDPREQLRGFVAIASEINARVGPLYRVLVTAAGIDRESAELLDQLTQQRQQGQGMFARSLARSRELRADLREGDAADVIHALVSPEMYRLLVIDRSWTIERYESWLTSTLVDQLLPRPTGS
jgi:AcrR family transcriptional regulator